MSSNPKIVVFQLKELIYTIIFVVLAILLIFLLVKMFAKSDEPCVSEPLSTYETTVDPASISTNTLDVVLKGSLHSIP